MIDSGIQTRVDRAKELLATGDSDDHKEAGWIVFKLSQMVERDPGVVIPDPGIAYKVQRLLASK